MTRASTSPSSTENLLTPILSQRERESIARRLRAQVIRMSHAGQAPHLASALSCLDILVAAYFGALRIDPANPTDPRRDRFIFSKGHAAAALYATLAQRGFFDLAELDQYTRHGGRLAEQPIPGALPGVEAATGSLGHGLSLGIGLALAGRIAGLDYRTCVLMGDGECNEGSVWEAALFAPAHRLDSLTAVIDFNRWQGTGRSEQIMALQPLRDKWAAFGWHAVECDGHDHDALTTALTTVTPGKPTAIIARTVKGRGVSFMEDDNNWHYRVPNDDELRLALSELT